MRLLALLTAALSARAVLLRTSGIYTLDIGGGLLLTHINGSSEVRASPASSSPDQAWSVIVDAIAKTATLQNVLTRYYVAEGPSSTLTALNASFPYTWNFTDSSDGQIGGFCAGSLCITLVTASGVLNLAPAGGITGIQKFEARPTPPPAVPPEGVYEIRNVASGKIISLFFLDPFLTSFPVFDRSGLWVVNQQGDDPSSISLRNYDSAGYLAVDGDNVTGTQNQYIWTVGFIEGLGQVLQSANDSTNTLTVTPDNKVVLGPAVDESSAWVFYPIDGKPFLP